jgi:hypothetical protein
MSPKLFYIYHRQNARPKAGVCPIFPYFAERFSLQIFDTGAELVMIFARISLFGNLSSIF